MVRTADPTQSRGAGRPEWRARMVDALRGHNRTVMGSAPLFPLVAGLIAGIVLDHFATPGAPAYLGGMVTAGLIGLHRPTRARIGPMILFWASAGAGGYLHLSTARTMPASSIERYANPNGRISRIRGVVASKPRVIPKPEGAFARWSFRTDRTVFLLACESIDGADGGIPVTGQVRVTVGEPILDLREGERVEMFGWLYALRPVGNPGAFDWAAYSRRQDIVAVFACNHREMVRRLESQPASYRPSLIPRLRETVRAMLTEDLAAGADEEASLLEAMVLGHRSRLDRRLNTLFIQAGCIHFLAVSGVHVLIVMFLARLACWPFRVGPTARTWVMLVTVVVYVLVAEPRPAILRAGIIAVLYCIACLLGRQRASLNWIAASAIILILVDPRTVFDVGWQLSFSAVLGVSYLTPALVGVAQGLRRWYRRVLYGQMMVDDDLTRPVDPAPQRGTVGSWLKRAWRFAWRYAAGVLAVSLGAWLVTLPIIATHFHRVQPWGAINSFLVFPLIGLVMALAFAKLAVGAISATLGAMLGQVLIQVDSFLIWVVEHLASLPAATVITQAPPWWLVVFGYLAFASLAWAFLRRTYEPAPPLSEAPDQEPSRSRRPALLCLITWVVLALSAAAWFLPGPPHRLVVTVLDVGAGSATVIELPDGRVILYDVGSLSRDNVGQHVVVPFLRHRGIRRIDRVYVSHANVDHLNGLPGVLDEMPTGVVFVNAHFELHSPPRSSSRHLLELLAHEPLWHRFSTGGKVSLETLDPAKPQWRRGGVTFDLLSPLDGPARRELSPNDSSTVLRLSYAGRSILLTGDIEERTQRALLERGNLGADVLLLPHHGSVRPSSRAFVEAVAPQVLIRSSHERMDETFSGLHYVVGDIPLFNTADVGAVQVVIDDQGLRVSSMRGQSFVDKSLSQ